MRTRVATVVIIIALTGLAAAIGYTSHPAGWSEFGDMGVFSGKVLMCTTSPRRHGHRSCRPVRAVTDAKVMVVLRRADETSTAIMDRAGVSRESSFSGFLTVGRYRATIQPATIRGCRANTTSVGLANGKPARLALVYRCHPS